MRHISIHILAACVALGLTASVVVAQPTWIVCCHGTGDFLTIQEGINAASDGDEVVVRDGAYFGPGNRDLDYGGKLITVRSENGPDNCVIDCEGSALDPHRAFWFHSGETADAIVQGFTICNGYMTNGGAVLCTYGSVPTIRQCVFRDNTAQGAAVANQGYGGAISCRALGGATIAQCAFLGNTAEGGTSRFTGRGGALACYEAGEVTLDSCIFRDNSAIAQTQQSGQGGAIWDDYSAHLEITGCQFVGNAALGSGYLLGGLGGAMISGYGSVTVVDSDFVGNRAEGAAFNAIGGAWHPSVDTEALVLNCTFAGNAADLNGGAVAPVACSSAWWVNCQFIGNSAGDLGGAFGSRSPNTHLINCTLAGNHAANRGGALYGDTVASGPAPFVVQNSVLWDNDAPLGPQGYVETTSGRPATLTVSYSDVEGGEEGIYVEPGSELIWGDGNIDAAPLFVGGSAGTWTDDGLPDPNAGQTTFTDDAAGWDPNELVGKFLNPDTTQYLQSLIVSNTDTTVTVWGDFESLGATGASYEINDYHLSVCSPAIDAGNNEAVPVDITTDLDGNPRFVDDAGMPDDGYPPDDEPYVDMGTYEFQSETCFGDLNGDDTIDLADLATLLANYETTGTVYTDGDLDRDEDVDLGDLAALLAVYGTTCE